MPAKKPPPVFEVLFEGHGIYPERIPLNSLARLLPSVQRLALGHDTFDDEEVPEGALRLLGVKRGSAVFQFVGPSPQPTLANLRVTGKVLENPDEIGENDFLLGPVAELSALAKALHCHIVLRQPGKDGPVLATIRPESYANLARTLLIKGDTSITGAVKRVGGATEMRCALRVSGQARMLYCSVATRELARRLGERLYQEVAVQGEATWLKNTWKVVRFQIRDVQQPQLGSAEDAIESLRRAGGSDWDEVEDPAAYLGEVRGER